MKYLYLLISICIFSIEAGEFTDEEFSEILGSDLIHSIHHEVIKKGRKEGLSFAGKGGSYVDGIAAVSYTFELQQSLGREAAEKLVRKMVSHVIQEYNRYEELAPFFEEFPITSDVVWLDIYFVDTEGRDLLSPDIHGVLQLRNRLIFYYKDAYSTSTFKCSKREQPFSKITMDNLFTEEVTLGRQKKEP